MTKQYPIKTLNDTKELAQKISSVANKNIYLLLKGDLGVGKTQLTKFIGEQLQVQTIITSPTFTILNEYNTSHEWKLIHIDAYRLNNSTDFSEYFELTKNNFSVIEWPENINWDFKNYKTITITFNFKDDIRIVTIQTLNLNKEEEKLLSYKKKCNLL